MNEKQTLIQKSKSAKKVKVETKPEPMAKMPQLKPTLGNNHSTPVNINTSTSSFELASNAPEAIMFTSGELTPPTPTIGQSNEQQFKPLDLSGNLFKIKTCNLIFINYLFLQETIKKSCVQPIIRIIISNKKLNNVQLIQLMNR